MICQIEESSVCVPFELRSHLAGLIHQLVIRRSVNTLCQFDGWRADGRSSLGVHVFVS